MPDFDPSDDYEARQLALIREQKPIVEALRKSGYEIDFLFAPKTFSIPDAARSLLEGFLQHPFSLDTKLMISDLLQQDQNEDSAQSTSSETESSRRVIR